MRATSYGARVLLGLCLLIVPLAACSKSKHVSSFSQLPGGMENRYRLTTEEGLARDSAEIQKYFDDPKENGQFTSAHGGVTIRYRVYLPQNPAIAKGAVVISSGRTESSLIYPELIYDLQKQGYSVFIHDHRGQGASGRLVAGEGKDFSERSHVEDFSYYVDDLHQFVTDVVAKNYRTDPNKRFLLAHSMGGGIASLYVENPRYRHDFAALALVTPMHEPILVRTGITKPIGWISEHVISWIFPDTGWAVGQEGYSEGTFAANDLTHSLVRWDQKRAVYRANEKHRIGGVTHGWINQAYQAGVKATKNAELIEIPVLVLQASGDTAVGSEAQEQFCGNVKVCRGFVVEQSYHAIFNEADTFRTPALTTVLDFFDHPPTTQQASKTWKPGPAANTGLAAAKGSDASAPFRKPV